MNNRLQLLVVIINYRSYDMTRRCIETLYPQIISTPGRRVVVVDNDSGDDSADRLDHAIVEHGWSDQVELVRSPVNGGFSAGNNVGIRHLDADYYLLINSDTEVRGGAIDEMLAGIEQLPGAGLIGPRLEWPDTEPQGSCFQFRHPGHEFFKAAGTGILERLFRVSPATLPISDKPVQSQWVSFACVMIRRAVIEQVGLMDEGYFMYEEDVDYCRQAGEAGWEVWYWPAGSRCAFTWWLEPSEIAYRSAQTATPVLLRIPSSLFWKILRASWSLDGQYPVDSRPGGGLGP